MGSGRKCPICNGCTAYRYYDHILVVYCDFCKKSFKLLSGGGMELIQDLYRYLTENGYKGEN